MKKLAKIQSAKLNIHERGRLMFSIIVDYEDGFSQSLGNIMLDEYKEEMKETVGTAYGCEMIRRCLLTVGVDDFSEMRGRYIWVIGHGDGGLSFKVEGIEALKVDKRDVEPFIFSEVYNKFTCEGK